MGRRAEGLRFTKDELRIFKIMDTENSSELDVRGGKPSASGMQRLALCPGSWLAELGLPEVVSVAAEMGTRLHKHLELGSLPEDEQEAEAVGWCREMEAQLAQKYVGVDEVFCREVRWWDAARSFSGQGDVVFAHAGCALVLDYKFGRRAVSGAADNLQLAALALLAFENLPDVEVVFCGILQPYVCRDVPQVVRYRREELAALRGFFTGLLERVQLPGARRVPGEVQCRYCKAVASCPACHGLMAERSQVDVAAAWPEWAPERKSEAVRLAQLAKRWAEAVERRAKADLKAGLVIPGCSLSAGKRCFKVSDAQGAFSALAEAIGISGEVFAGCCSVKISELDKVVHRRRAELAPDGTKVLVKDSAAWLRELLADAEAGAVCTSEPSLKVD